MASRADEMVLKHSTRSKPDLERIRNNQRRSRARRKQYIEELEDKIRTYEASESQNVANTSIQALVKENDALRKLLKSISLGSEFITAYINATKMALKTSKIATAPDIQAPSQLNDESCCETTGCSSSKSIEQAGSEGGLNAEAQAASPFEAYVSLHAADQAHSIQQDSTLSCQPVDAIPWELSFDFSNYFSVDAPSFPVPEPASMPLPAISIEDISAAEEDSIIPAEQKCTILCSVAFSLVMMVNRKGYDAGELDLKLRAGYRYGQAAPEGCRIENAILLRVLAEIMQSSNSN